MRLVNNVEHPSELKAGLTSSKETDSMLLQIVKKELIKKENAEFIILLSPFLHR